MQSFLYLTYDDSQPIHRRKMPRPKQLALKTVVKKHDGEVWTDDSIELFLDTNTDRKTYYQFITNARGMSFEGSGLDSGKWDCKWVVKTSADSGGWSAEMAIPFVSLGVSAPKPGTVWRFNVVRNFRGTRATQLFCTYGFNHRPKMFGQLVFCDGALSQTQLKVAERKRRLYPVCIGQIS